MRPWPFDPLNPFSYDVAVIDCPWPWDAYSDKGLEKSPEAQYETMTMEDIADLPVGDLLAPSGVLLCWATWPLIYEQCSIVKRWGIEIKTGGVWHKKTINNKSRWGTGYILRSICEPFLICTLRNSGWRGSSEVNLIETLSEYGPIEGVAREHSRKPDEIYSLVERVMPGKRYADVFSRENRPGWSCYGNETGKFDK